MFHMQIVLCFSLGHEFSCEGSISSSLEIPSHRFHTYVSPLCDTPPCALGSQRSCKNLCHKVHTWICIHVNASACGLSDLILIHLHVHKYCTHISWFPHDVSYVLWVHGSSYIWHYINHTHMDVPKCVIPCAFSTNTFLGIPSDKLCTEISLEICAVSYGHSVCSGSCTLLCRVNKGKIQYQMVYYLLKSHCEHSQFLE